MQAFIVEILNRFGYLGIYLLITVEALFPPLPAESVLLLTGFASKLEGVTLNPWLVALVSTLGSTSGALIIYFLGSFLTHEKLDAWLKKHLPRYPGLRRGLNKTFAFFYKYNQSAVFFGRFVPVVRPLISWPAGMTRMPLIPFVTFTFIACGISNTFYVFMGNTVGVYKQQLWDFVMEHIAVVSVLGGMILLIVAIHLILKYRAELEKRLLRKERFRQARLRREQKKLRKAEEERLAKAAEQDSAADVQATGSAASPATAPAATPATASAATPAAELAVAESGGEVDEAALAKRKRQGSEQGSTNSVGPSLPGQVSESTASGDMLK